MTLISKIDEKHIDKNEIKKQAEILKKGNTVIFPTETVYGLGANALDEVAVSKIYEAKGRPSDNPLIVHIYDKEQVNDLAKEINENAKIIMNEFWPGPITIILKKKDIVPMRTSGGLDTVAIRMPSNPIAKALLEEVKLPIAAPSANISGRPSPTRGKHVYEEMNNRVDGIILGGDCTFGLESTVLDLTNDIPTILRPGSITKEDLEQVIGTVNIDPALERKEDNIKAKAPGMKYKHYAPNADVTIVEGPHEKVVQYINRQVSEKEAEGHRCAVMATDETKDKYICNDIVSAGHKDDELSVARNLYAILRDFDKQKVEYVYSESFETKNVGQAVMNRLIKAAGHKIVKLD